MLETMAEKETIMKRFLIILFLTSSLLSCNKEPQKGGDDFDISKLMEFWVED